MKKLFPEQSVWQTLKCTAISRELSDTKIYFEPQLQPERL